MGAKTPADFAEKWGRNTKGAVQDYAKGVRAVSTAPGQAAAQRADAYLSGVQRSVSEGKWQERVAAVGLSEWQSKTIDKGVPRIAQGVDSAQPDVMRFAAEVLPHIEAGRSALEATPRGDLETNLNRMVTFSRHMANFRRSP